MPRFILVLIAFVLSPAAFAGSCTEVFIGAYPSSADSASACAADLAATLSSGAQCYSNDTRYRPPGNSFLSVASDSDPDSKTLGPRPTSCEFYTGATTIYEIHYTTLLSQCPEGSVSVPELGGVCACIGNASLNPSTGQCEALPADDDFSDEEPVIDESPNTGEGSGDGNSHGGEVGENGDGSECNFSPEGCAPGDVATPPPDVADLTPPDVDTQPPAGAVTKNSSSETDNSTGTTKTVEVKEWEEPDGSIVRQTVTTTTNSDGSSSKETTTTRTSPDGSSSSTTGRWDTDSQGNTTLTGSSESKEAEKENSASGGLTCDTPPQCNGDAIHCAQLRQQWLTRCDKSSSYSDSNCTAQPQCDGDVLLCAGLINTWQDRCALEKAAFDAQAEFEDRGFKTAEQVMADGGPFIDGGETDLGNVADGVLSSRSSTTGSCPAPKSFDAGPFGVHEVSLQPFCDLAEMIYWIVLLSAYLTGTFIIFRSVQT